MKCHQIRRFCWLRLKTHKGEMKILCILAQQKWFQKSFFHNFKKMPWWCIFRIIIKYVLQQKSGLKSHFHFLRFWSNFYINSVSLTLTVGHHWKVNWNLLETRFSVWIKWNLSLDGKLNSLLHRTLSKGKLDLQVSRKTLLKIQKYNYIFFWAARRAAKITVFL